MPSVSVWREILAPVADVWKVLSDVENARRWNRAWDNIQITSSQRHGVGTTFRARAEEGESYEFRVTEWDPPALIAFEPIREEGESYGINLESHVFRLRETGEGRTLVELTANASARGLRGRLVGIFLWRGYQKQGLNQALDSLEAIFEPGERERTADGQGAKGNETATSD